jgi:hypothetical protein
MGRSVTWRFRLAIGLVAIGVLCAGCQKEDLGAEVAHKPHEITGPKKGGGADMDLLPAPAGMKTGTPK